MEESRNSILEVSFEKSVSKLIRKIYGSFLYNNRLHEETFNDRVTSAKQKYRTFHELRSPMGG
ncbi:hypothetical protein C7967_105108 [Thalassospira sp. 11-3]|nr:hypothetical protein KO164_3740 [Thalassospira sp. KO164]PXX31941.1 hypothetical protein C7967_105108 [Thalassospira sp. 11-3]SEE76447.1 hypothetical protein SAMN04515623_3784 [Thalassospira permensis]